MGEDVTEWMFVCDTETETDDQEEDSEGDSAESDESDESDDDEDGKPNWHKLKEVNVDKY